MVLSRFRQSGKPKIPKIEHSLQSEEASRKMVSVNVRNNGTSIFHLDHRHKVAGLVKGNLQRDHRQTKSGISVLNLFFFPAIAEM